MFFPYGDENPRKTIPLITIFLITANIIIFFIANTQIYFKTIVYTYGFIPNNFSFITIFTSMFLHQDLFHLISNMWFLWLFGDNVEDKLGKLAFLFLATWFLLQFMSVSGSSGYATNIAYWAHIGGFIFGVAIGLASRFFSFFGHSI